MTILEMAQAMGMTVSTDAIKRRLQREGIQPFKYIGPTGIYKKDDFAAIRDKGIGSRSKTSKTTPIKKTKKTAKKK